MKARAVLLTVALCLVAAVVCFADDAQMGTWKLNLAKSKLGPGAPKNSVVVYQAEGDNVKVTVDGIGDDGKPIHNEWTGKFDGKDYPVIGDPNFDLRSYTLIDDRTLGFNFKKGGKLKASGRIEVSTDGKSRTVTMRAIDAKGKKVMSAVVYDKQ
jgi:hypothetical protein